MSFKVFEGNLNVAGQPEYILDAHKLHYDKESKTFSVEVSDLGSDFYTVIEKGVETIYIMNSKTNKICPYQKTRDRYDNEHELLYTEYAAPRGSIAYGTKLLVFND